MSNSVFFTSDTHFGHKKLSDLRGFPNVEVHDQTLIDNWNSVITKGDRVYHLGDVALGCKKERTIEILSSLNGQIYLLRGNHDDRIFSDSDICKRFVWCRSEHYFTVNDQKIHLLHYAMRVWRSSHRGSWHLYGHSHGSLRDAFYDEKSLSMDVGVDCHNFTPISFEQVADRMRNKQFSPVDHHGDHSSSF